MRNQLIKTTALSAVLLLGAAVVPSYAIDVGLGGSGGPSVSATIGGGNNVANATVNAAGNTANVSIGNTSGPLASVNSKDSTTNANVNLGDTLNAVGGIVGGGGGLLGGGGKGTQYGGGAIGGDCGFDGCGGGQFQERQRYPVVAERSSHRLFGPAAGAGVGFTTHQRRHRQLPDVDRARLGRP